MGKTSIIIIDRYHTKICTTTRTSSDKFETNLLKILVLIFKFVAYDQRLEHLAIQKMIMDAMNMHVPMLHNNRGFYVACDL